MQPNVSIIVLNWNGWEDTIECLESLYQIKYPNYEIILIDNGSKDESMQKIKKFCKNKLILKSDYFKYDNKPISLFEFKEEDIEKNNINISEFKKCQNRKLLLIKCEKNYGFAKGNNIGMDFILNYLNSDITLLLNNDTVVEKNFLDELVEIALNDPKIGVLGPKIYFYDDNEKIFSLGGLINHWTGTTSHRGFGKIDKGQFNGIKEVHYVSGCALLIKNELIRKIGGFYEGYFNYYEETEWCMKVTEANYKVIVVPKSIIWHKIASTSKKSYLYLYYKTRNRFIFMKRNFDLLKYISSSLIFFITYFPYECALNLYKKDLKSLKVFYKAIKDGIFY